MKSRRRKLREKVLLSLKNEKSIIEHSKLVFMISGIYLLPLMIILVINLVGFNFSDDYFLGYPLKKIIPIIFFIINQVLFLFVLALVWYLYFGYSVKSYFYSILLVAGFLLSFLLLSFLYTFNTDEYIFKENKTKFDYGIILGAAVWSGNMPSPIFKGRIKKGAELYKGGVINKIHLTGGNAPGEISEAKAAYNYLLGNHNIQSDDIFIEEETSTTNEQIKFIKQNLQKQRKDIKFLIISDEFHLKRIQEMADFYNINSCVISSDKNLNIGKSLSYRFRDCTGLILFWLFAI